MSTQPFVVVEQSDETILGVRVRDTEEEAIDIAMEIIRDGDQFPEDIDMNKARQELVVNSIWNDGHGWIISITQASE